LWLVSLIYRAEAITLMSVDYGAALFSPGLLWSTRRLDTSTSLGRQAGVRHTSIENLQPKGCNQNCRCGVRGEPNRDLYYVV
jgi:hypothetical protein